MHGLSWSCIYHPKHTFALIFFSFEHRTTERSHDQSTSYLSPDVLFTFAVYRLYLFAECVKFRNNQVVSEGLANEKYVDAYTSEKVTADFLKGGGGGSGPSKRPSHRNIQTDKHASCEGG